MMNLAHLLIRSARSFSAQPAIFEGKRQVHDYAGLATRAAVLANHLADDCALLPGDRVALVMTNNPSYVEVLFRARPRTNKLGRRSRRGSYLWVCPRKGLTLLLRV